MTLSPKMSVPDDVVKAAAAIAERYTDIDMAYHGLVKAVSEAILAERRRCATIANDKADELYAAAWEATKAEVDRAATSLADQAFAVRSIATAISIGDEI